MRGPALARFADESRFWVLRGEIVAADVVGTGCLRLLLLVALGENENAHRLARSMREHDAAAHHLVCVLRIDAEIHREIDALVELGDRRVLQHFHGGAKTIGLFAIDELLASVERETLLLLLAGGVVYSLGTIFHLSSRLPYQQALWHASVLVAASIHYAAILSLLTP